MVEGKFEGFIQTYQGKFYVEPAERYLKDRDVPFHSVIYHEDDISEYCGGVCVCVKDLPSTLYTQSSTASVHTGFGVPFCHILIV